MAAADARVDVRIDVRIAENFARNLLQIEEFLGPRGDRAYHRLVDHILDVLVPNLEQYPRLGVDFLARPARSVETEALRRQLLAATGGEGEVREYVTADHLILYWWRRSTVYLLSVKHHRQLSFDLLGHWEVPP
jgi:hypothetical protein